MKRFLAFAFALILGTVAYAQNPGTVTNHAFVIGKGPGVTGYTSLLCASGQLAVGQAADPVCRSVSGDATFAATGVMTLATVNGNVGTFGSATQCSTLTVNGKGLVTAASAATCTPAVGNITGLGTGVATALTLNIGSAGAPVTFNGAGGTPSSIVLTNGTGLPTTGLAGTLQAAQEPAHTGDVTNPASSLVLTLNTVNSSPGTFGSATQVPQFAVNGKGLVTAATPITITPAFSNITGTPTTLAGYGITNAATYAQGTWTPAITALTTPGTPSYSVQVGSYEVIGRFVHVQFTVILTGWTGTPAGIVEILGLPFAAANTTNDFGVCSIGNFAVTGLTAGASMITGIVPPGGSAIEFLQTTNAGSLTITPAQTGATPTLNGFCNYHT